MRRGPAAAQAVVGHERALAAGRPPPAPERRRRDHTDHKLVSLLQCQQRRPDGDPADVVLRAVDRIDDPAASAGAGLGLPVLLAKDRVAGVPLGEALADRFLDGAIRFGDRRQIRLGLDHEIVGLEAIHRDRVRHVSQGERKIEIVGHGAGWY